MGASCADLDSCRNPYITRILHLRADKSCCLWLPAAKLLSPCPLLDATMLAAVKKTCKRIVGASNDDAAVVTPRDWAERIAHDPVQRVRLCQSSPAAIFEPYLTVMLIAQTIGYVTSLFPIFGWISRYSASSHHCHRRLLLTVLTDFGWASGDLIAGLTVGIVLVPQSMSYAQVCKFPAIEPRFMADWHPDCHLAARVRSVLIVRRRLGLLRA